MRVRAVVVAVAWGGCGCGGLRKGGADLGLWGPHEKPPPTPTSRYLGEGERPEAPARDERLPAGPVGAVGAGGRYSLRPPHTPGGLLASRGLGPLTSGSLARHAPSSGTRTRPPPRGTDAGSGATGP